MSGKTERVQVEDDPRVHKVLKSYAETYGMTPDTVLYRCTRLNFHRQQLSAISGGMMDLQGIKPEGGHDKP